MIHHHLTHHLLFGVSEGSSGCPLMMRMGRKKDGVPDRMYRDFGLSSDISVLHAVL
jgi:hypothetical protein